MEIPSDTDLLDGVRNGQARAFTVLYQRYKLPLYRFCLHMVRDSAKAEDAAHDTFVALLHRAETIREGSSLKAWLFQVARNNVLMTLRNRATSALSGTDEVCDTDSPLSIMEKGERVEQVRKMLSCLNLEYREVLILREYDELSYAEIAAITGSTESAVKSRLFKARRALARKLAPVIHEEALP